MATIEKLAPFARKAAIIVVGRDRLLQMKNRLAFVLITEDIAENSRKKALESFPCPIFQKYKSEDIQKLFGFYGTKMLGFKRSPISNKIMQELKEFRE